MASVNLQKHNTQEACSGIIRHNYRESSGHSNKDIRPELSHLNKTYGCMTGNEARERLKQRIRQLDEIHPPQRIRADRKTCLSIVVTSPREGMTPEQEAAWADAAWGVLGDMFGDNLIDGVYHADEVHEYLERDGTVHTSRGHLHADAVPWMDGYGLNMKHFFTKDLPVRINAALDAKCMEMFGFPYQDGTRKKSKGTVEELKAAEVVQKREAAAQAEADLSNALFELQETQEALQRTNKEKSTLEEQNEALRTNNEALKGKAKEMEARAATAEKKANEAEARLTSIFSQFKEKVGAWIKGHHDLERILRTAFWLSPKNAKKIEQRMEATVERGGKALAKADESAESFLAANNELDMGIQDFSYLRTTVKKRQDIDIDLEEELGR